MHEKRVGLILEECPFKRFKKIQNCRSVEKSNKIVDSTKLLNNVVKSVEPVSMY